MERNKPGGTKSSWASVFPARSLPKPSPITKIWSTNIGNKPSTAIRPAPYLNKEFIIDGKTFNDLNVITLKLAFNQSFCASGTEGMHIKKERIVIVDDAGIVLHISGDGPTGVPIFA